MSTDANIEAQVAAAVEKVGGATTTQDLFLVALDVEGTLTPEAWLELQAATGLEELKKTTAHEPDYDKLMRYRIDVLNQNNIKIDDMKKVVQDLAPLEGAVDFLEWLKPIVRLQGLVTARRLTQFSLSPLSPYHLSLSLVLFT